MVCSFTALGAGMEGAFDRWKGAPMARFSRIRFGDGADDRAAHRVRRGVLRGGRDRREFAEFHKRITGEHHKYLITVGRFRQFVNAWFAGWRPAAGSGKHSHLNGGEGLANSASRCWPRIAAMTCPRIASVKGPGARERREVNGGSDMKAPGSTPQDQAGADESVALASLRGHSQGQHE